ncbi:MAG: elongation factor P maturation arginine rhamnosyltransferase EarP, partial [Burkholderiaceae bacterium]
LRESDLLKRQAGFDRQKWLSRFGINANAGQLVSLFCYEPDALPALLVRLREGAMPTQLLVTHGRATVAVRRWMGGIEPGHSPGAHVDIGNLTLIFLPALSQLDFDHLLWSCDLNFVRGEDSVARAIWADRPFVWQIYPQGDGAHHAKLDAVLQAMATPASWRSFHAAWNGVSATLPEWDLPAWRRAASGARAALLAQSDLATRLLEFAEAPQTSRSVPENR